MQIQFYIKNSERNTNSQKNTYYYLTVQYCDLPPLLPQLSALPFPSTKKQTKAKHSKWKQKNRGMERCVRLDRKRGWAKDFRCQERRPLPVPSICLNVSSPPIFHQSMLAYTCPVLSFPPPVLPSVPSPHLSLNHVQDPHIPKPVASFLPPLPSQVCRKIHIIYPSILYYISRMLFD